MSLSDAGRHISTYGIPEISDVLAAHRPDTRHSEAAERNAAVAMVLRETNGGAIEALFIQRAEHPDDPWSGHMALPGGRHEPHDETLQAAAVRETLEEVGLNLEQAAELGQLHDVFGGRLREFSLAVSAFVYHHPDPPALTLNHEVADTVWVPLDYLGDPANIESYVFPPDPQQRQYPSFQYRGYTIWGLTYRILVNYFELFGVALPCDYEVTDVE